MTRVQAQLEKLATEVARSVVQALAKVPMEQLTALVQAGRFGGAPPQQSQEKSEQPASQTRKPGVSKGEEGKRKRRSGKELQGLVERVVRAVEEHPKPEGVAVGELAKALRRPSTELSRPLHLALEAGRLKKTGDRRHTRYFPVA